MESDSTQSQQINTYQRTLCDRIPKLESDNVQLREQISSLSITISELKGATTSNTSRFHCFSDTFAKETAGLQANISSIITQLEGLDAIKEQQSIIAAKHSSLISDTKQKVKPWASVCSNTDSQPLANIDKMVQGKIEDERVRWVRELNLRVRGLPSTHYPLAAGCSFLCDQLGLIEITLDRC